jgi:hypothetical protein
MSVRDHTRVARRGKCADVARLAPKAGLALLATITSPPWTDIVGNTVHDHRRRERARGSRRNDVGLAPNVKKKKIFFRLFSDLYFIFFMCFIFPG